MEMPPGRNECRLKLQLRRTAKYGIIYRVCTMRVSGRTGFPEGKREQSICRFFVAECPEKKRRMEKQEEAK